MIKYCLVVFQLAMLSASTAKAQFVAGAGGLLIVAGSEVSIGGLTMKPSADFAITSNSLTVSATPVPGIPASIARVYSFSQPVDYSGSIGFFYQTAELNGNTESTLQLAHGNENFLTTTGSTVDLGLHYISNNLAGSTNFTSVTAAQEGALPVTLVSFQVKRVESVTMLYWQTSAETNSDFHEVQQSPDARKWNTLGKVTAAGESKNFKDYSFQDHALRSGRQYYRLKMVDADGSYAYSAIRSVDLGSAELAAAYPNPVIDKLFIGGTAPVTSMRLTDLSGKTLLELANPAAGQHVNMKNYAAGSYLVQFNMADGKNQIVKIIKQ